jgi:hypothetical protein
VRVSLRQRVILTRFLPSSYPVYCALTLITLITRLVPLTLFPCGRQPTDYLVVIWVSIMFGSYKAVLIRKTPTPFPFVGSHATSVCCCTH